MQLLDEYGKGKVISIFEFFTAICLSKVSARKNDGIDNKLRPIWLLIVLSHAIATLTAVGNRSLICVTPCFPTTTRMYSISKKMKKTCEKILFLQKGN